MKVITSLQKHERDDPINQHNHGELGNIAGPSNPSSAIAAPSYINTTT